MYPRQSSRQIHATVPTLARILASDSIEAVCAATFKARGHELVEKPGIKKEELLKIIGEFDGLVVRSGTKVGHANPTPNLTLTLTGSGYAAAPGSWLASPSHTHSLRLAHSNPPLPTPRLQVTKEIMDAGTNLKIIGRAGTGVDNIDVRAATNKVTLTLTLTGATNKGASAALPPLAPSSPPTSSPKQPSHP